MKFVAFCGPPHLSVSRLLLLLDWIVRGVGRGGDSMAHFGAFKNMFEEIGDKPGGGFAKVCVCICDRGTEFPRSCARKTLWPCVLLYTAWYLFYICLISATHVIKRHILYTVYIVYCGHRMLTPPFEACLSKPSLARDHLHTHQEISS